MNAAKRLLFLLFSAYSLVGLLPSRSAAQETSPPPEKWLFLCDQSVPEISGWQFRPEGKEEAVRKWTWNPAADSGLKKGEAAWFSHPTDVKLTHDGTSLLVTASGGGVARVSLAEKRVLWHRRPDGNPHSVEQLPNGDVVVASSTGHFLAHFRKDGEEIGRHEVQHAHGVVWDEARKTLWALGALHLHAFQLSAEETLVPAGPIPLPVRAEFPNAEDDGGHDLILLPSGDLMLSDAHHVWNYAPKSGEFTLWRQLASVKSVAETPGVPNGFTLLVATKSWWSPEVRFYPEDSAREFPGTRNYKARWIPAPTP